MATIPTRDPYVIRYRRARLTRNSDALAALPYLNAVIRESLRLHPSVPQTMRVATEDVVIPLHVPVINRDGTLMESVLVPKGTTVAIRMALQTQLKEVLTPQPLCTPIARQSCGVRRRSSSVPSASSRLSKRGKARRGCGAVSSPSLTVPAAACESK